MNLLPDLSSECPFMADSRSLARADQRLVTRKQLLKLEESAAIGDPELTLVLCTRTILAI